MFAGALPPGHWGADLRAAADEAIGGLASIMENGKRAGLFGARNTDDLVLTALSTVHGLSLLISGGLVERGDASGKQLRALATRVYDTLMLGLLERKA